MLKDTLLHVLKPVGPSGSEQPAYEALAEMIRPHVDTLRTDALGNLIATRPGKPGGKRIMLSAHMDTIGFIALDADKEGFLRLSALGGVSPQISVARHIRFSNGVGGIIYSEPTGSNRNEKNVTMATLYADIGTTSREQALAKVPVGTSAVVDFQVTDMGDLVSAPYMDDRAACAVLVGLLQSLEDCPNEIVAVFSTQEEVGCRGAGVAAFSIEPDIGIAVDVTGAGDTPKCDPLPMKVGHGPTVKVKDSGSISTPAVRDALVAAALHAGVPFQYEVLPYGGTDASAIMHSRAGVPSGTVSIPCRYVHSPVETVSLSDMENAVRLLKAYVETIVK